MPEEMRRSVILSVMTERMAIHMLWNARNGEVSIGDTKMSYASFGHGERVFVILPGLSDGLATVRGKALLLAKPYRSFFDEFTVFMFSRKDEMPEGYSIRDMAEDQSEALKKLGIQKACVMGVSQGGMIAQEFAIHHPELVDRLVLALTAPYANKTVQRFVRELIEEAKRSDHRAIMIASAESAYSQKKLKSYRKLYPLLGMIGKPKDYGRFLSNANAILCFDARDGLKQIRCPTLILGGEEDRTVGPEGSHELHAAIAGSELHMYPGLGHAAFEEAPDFNRRVLAFLKGRTIICAAATGASPLKP